MTYVTSLDESWRARESTCDQDSSGDPNGPVGDATLNGNLVLGEFPDGDAFSGALLEALGGLRLRDIEALSYSERATGGQDGYNAGYMRIFTAQDGAVIFSPSTQAGGPGSTLEWRRHNVVRGSVRYDDDAGNAPDVSWASMIAAHGDEVVTQIRVQAGCAGDYSDGSMAYVDDVVLVGGEHATHWDFE